MKNCVYRFLNKDNEIIYVGKAKNLKQRIHNHFSGYGHLPETCYKNISKVEYIACKSITEMSIKEIYFINKYNPLYNTKDKYEDSDIFSLKIFDENKWTKYNLKGNIYINKIHKLEKELDNKNNEINKLNVAIKDYYTKLTEASDNAIRYKYLYEQLEKLILEYDKDTSMQLSYNLKLIKKDPYWADKVTY